MWQARRNTERTPPCVHEDEIGYELDGQITIGPNKWSARLKRKGIHTVFGMDVYDKINVDVEMLNEYALRIYVRN